MVLLVSLLAGCNASKNAAKAQRLLNNDYCVVDTNEIADYVKPYCRNTDSLFSRDTLLSKIFSRKEIAVANAAGMIPLIRQWLDVHQFTSVDDRIEQLQINLRIQQRIARIREEISGITAELNCESERATRAIDYLDNFYKTRNTRLTVAAIIAGAFTTIVPIAVKDQGTQNALVISGAAASTIFGVLALRSNKKTVEFVHRRNWLTDIWYAPAESNLYPPAIWFMLTGKEFNSGRADMSIQQNLKWRWMDKEFGNALDPDLEKLVFSQGGIYSEDNLSTRRNLLKQLQAAVQLLNVHIEMLAASLNRMMVP